MANPSNIHVYIDETGDRGLGPKASPIFGMAAILLDETGVSETRTAVARLRHDLNVPSGKLLSWKASLKTHDLRKRAVEVLGAVDGVRVCYVYAQKSALSPTSYVGNQTLFYNYVAYKLYKSVLWAARDWKGSSARVWTRFGHVRKHDHSSTKSYIQREAALDGRIPNWMEQGLSWVSADRYEESQAADIYGGFLKAALWPNGQFMQVEGSYLVGIWHQIRNSRTCVIPLGLLSMPENDLVKKNAWFPCTHCTK